MNLVGALHDIVEYSVCYCYWWSIRLFACYWPYNFRIWRKNLMILLLNHYRLLMMKIRNVEWKVKIDSPKYILYIWFNRFISLILFKTYSERLPIINKWHFNAAAYLNYTKTYSVLKVVPRKELSMNNIYIFYTLRLSYHLLTCFAIKFYL